MSRGLVAGVDTSTQACKVVVRDADTGELVREPRRHTRSAPRWPRPRGGTRFDGDRGSPAVSTTSRPSGGRRQQHGMVCLDDDGAVVRAALLWNDVRSAGAAADLIAELGDGDPDACAGVGRRRRPGPGRLLHRAPSCAGWPTRSPTPPTERPPSASPRLADLAPGAGLGLDSLVTDRGDASGTAYWSARTGEYRRDLLELAMRGRDLMCRAWPVRRRLGHLAGSDAVLGPGTGDNAAPRSASRRRPRDVVVSIGTSGVVSSSRRPPVADLSGRRRVRRRHRRHLPLVATLNAARVLDAAAALLGVDHPTLSDLALAAPAGAEGLVLVPYLEGERTPNLPGPRVRARADTAHVDAGYWARAAVEGLLCGLADGVEAVVAWVSRWSGSSWWAARRRPGRCSSWRPRFGLPVSCTPGEYVADGAARQAAWVLSGAAAPPEWAQPACGSSTPP